MTAYEIRSPKGRPVMAFDNIDRARAALDSHSSKWGIRLRLFEVKREEREIQ